MVTPIAPNSVPGGSLGPLCQPTQRRRFRLRPGYATNEVAQRSLKHIGTGSGRFRPRPNGVCLGNRSFLASRTFAGFRTLP